MADWNKGGVKGSCEIPAECVKSSLSTTSPLLDFTLRCGPEPGREVKCSKILLACNSRTLRESFDTDPSLVEIVLPSLKPEAVAVVCRLLTHHVLELSWGELSDVCAAVDLLQVRVVHSALCGAAEKLYTWLDPARETDAYLRTEYMYQRCAAFLRDVLELGLQYDLPGLVEVGIKKSLVHVAYSKQAAHFEGLPESVMTQVSALRMVRCELHSRSEAHWVAMTVFNTLGFIWLCILTGVLFYMNSK